MKINLLTSVTLALLLLTFSSVSKASGYICQSGPIMWTSDVDMSEGQGPSISCIYTELEIMDMDPTNIDDYL